MSALTITNIEPAWFAGLEALQRACYPTLAEHELMKVEHFRSQHAIFPEGQFVVLDRERVIGQGSGFFTNFDFEHPNHRFNEICDNFYFRNHDPAGAYYYGADISVHPDYQGHGIGKLLYKARKDLAINANRRGIVAGGLLPGYARYKGQLSVQDYVARVVAGELFDPTLSFQLKQGFIVRGLLPDYLDDSAADNWATLIVWQNPQYHALDG